MLKYAFPLVPNALIWWLINASDRSIVLLFLGPASNGILAMAHKIPTIITTAYNIFHISWTEAAALHFKEADKDEFFSGVFDTVYRISVSASICLIVSIPYIFRVINEQYYTAYYQIPIYTLAAFFNVIVGLYSVVYIAEMKTKEIMKTSFWSGIINVTIHLGLIRFIGLFAASVSSAFAFGIMAIYRAWDVRKYIRQKINVCLLISSVIIIVFVLVMFYLRNDVSNIISIVIAIGYAVIINFKILQKIMIEIYNKILKKR